MGESICHFCKSKNIKCVKHRSTVLNFDCSMDAKTNLQIPEDLGPWMFFKALFFLQALLSLHYSYWHTLYLKSEWRIVKVLPERTGLALMLMWSQTAGFHLSLCISAWESVSVFLSHSIVSSVCLILKFLYDFPLYQRIWIITPRFWAATLSLQVEPKGLASHMQTCSVVFLTRSK